jgi:hypothetical protein
MCIEEQLELLLLGNNRPMIYDLYHAMYKYYKLHFMEFIATYVIRTQSHI